jgi:hypothetical protein
MIQEFYPPALEYLQPAKGVVDLRLVEKLRASMWDPPSLQWHVDQIVSKGLDAYVTPKGLVLLETVEWTRGRELRVYGIAGRDILKNGEAVVRDLRRIARYKACTMIGGEGIPKGWLRAAPALGFEPVSTHYVMEL